MKSDRRERTPWSLRQRLLAFLLGPLLLVLCGSLVADFKIAFDTANEAFDHALADDAVALAGRVKVGDGKIEVDLPAAAEAVLRSDTTDKEFFAIYSPDGKLLAGDYGLRAEAVGADGATRTDDDTMGGLKVRKATYAFVTPLGVVPVVVAETAHKRERAGSRIFAAIILPNLLVVVATLILIYFGVRSGLAPLNQLGEEIARRSPHDLSPLPTDGIPGEAEPLVKAMATLIDDLRSLATAQQAFLANAAHQLKTPLAGLQTQLELAAEEIPEAYRPRVVQLRDATRRIGRLAHQLLALARSGPDADVVHERRVVDLAGVIEENVSIWYDQALAAGIDLGFETQSVRTEGSRWLLRELLANLVDNALRYTPAGGHVTVRSGIGDDGGAFLEVEDSGPGIPESERARVFDRFYRSPGAPGSGTGLGLAIVKEVADRHGANVGLTTPASGGMRIRIAFPLLQPPVGGA